MNTPTAIAATQTKLTTTIRLMSLGLETSVVMSAWKMVRKTNAGRSLEKINIILKMGECETPRELRGIIGEYIRKHNDRRLHESSDYEAPASWCYSGIAAQLAA
jgi:hypothetical protein